MDYMCSCLPRAKNKRMQEENADITIFTTQVAASPVTRSKRRHKQWHQPPMSCSNHAEFFTHTKFVNSYPDDPRERVAKQKLSLSAVEGLTKSITMTTKAIRRCTIMYFFHRLTITTTKMMYKCTKLKLKLNNKNYYAKNF